MGNPGTINKKSNKKVTFVPKVHFVDPLDSAGLLTFGREGNINRS